MERDTYARIKKALGGAIGRSFLAPPSSATTAPATASVAC
jgi:hypothetical protein